MRKALLAFVCLLRVFPAAGQTTYPVNGQLTGWIGGFPTPASEVCTVGATTCTFPLRDPNDDAITGSLTVTVPATLAGVETDPVQLGRGTIAFTTPPVFRVTIDATYQIPKLPPIFGFYGQAEFTVFDISVPGTRTLCALQKGESPPTPPQTTVHVSHSFQCTPASLPTSPRSDGRALVIAGVQAAALGISDNPPVWVQALQGISWRYDFAPDCGGAGAGTRSPLDEVCGRPPAIDSILPSVVSNSATGFQADPVDVTIAGVSFPQDGTLGIGGDVIVQSPVLDAARTKITAKLTSFRRLPEGPRDVVLKSASTGATVPGGKGLFFVSGLDISPLEITQGIRLDPDKTCTTELPCIAYHDTVVRATVSCNPDGSLLGCPLEPVAARLHVFRAGTTVPIGGSPFRPIGLGLFPYRALPTGVEFRPFAALDSADGTLNFILRSFRLEPGAYDFVLEVDPRDPGKLPTGALDTLRNLVRTATGKVFREGAGIRKVVVMIDREDYVSHERVAEALRIARAELPAGDRSLPAVTMAAPIRFVPGEGGLTTLLALNLLFEALREADPSLSDLLFFTPSLGAGGSQSFCANHGTDSNADFRCPNPVSIVGIAESRDHEAELVGQAVAHELGHHLQLGDTWRGERAQRSLLNPVTGCADNGCPVETGNFDMYHFSVAAPPASRKVDFMGWELGGDAHATWTNNANWKVLAPRFEVARSRRAEGTAVAELAQVPQELLSVSGTVGSDGRGALSRVRRVRAELPEDPPAGAYAVELQGSAGQALARKTFSVVFSVGPGTLAPFAVSLPFAAGTARVVLKHGDAELASLAVSANAPAVRVVSPNGGEALSGAVTLRWTGSDADGDALVYDVFYSPDGSTWMPVALSRSDASFEWDTRAFPGTKAGRIRVVASDGANLAEDSSDGTFTLPLHDPIVTLTSPADGATLPAGVPLSLQGGAFDPEDGFLDGRSLSFSSSRDGALGDGSPLLAAGLSAGVHTLTLKATDKDGRASSASITVRVFSRTAAPDEVRFVPIVLSTAGVNGSFFTSELTVTNRGATDAAAELAYQPAFGGGTATSGYVTLPAGRQLVVSDALAYLVSLGVRIPDQGNRGGTLTVKLYGAASASAVSATVRTTTAVPQGNAGLSYPGVPPALLAGTVFLAGLRQTETDRSNVALQNSGGAAAGNLTLRLTVFSGDPAHPIAAVLPNVYLAPGQFTQLSGILASNGLALGSGYVKVERVAGTAPFYAYAVINDQITSDGSFVPPVPESALAGKAGLTVPVIVETGAPSFFASELVATNTSAVQRTLRFAFVADAVDAPDRTASFTLELAPGEQRVIPSLVAYLRDQHVPGIGAVGAATYAGSLFATVQSGDAAGIVVGVRTSSPAPGGGRFGLFYSAVPQGAAATSGAWVYGLQQNDGNRSNLAIVNTGEVDGSGSTYRIEIFDGDTGRLVKTLDTSLGPRRFVQLSGVLKNSPGTTHGYVHVVRTAGNNPFLAYGVINDGGSPGVRSDDGAFVAMEVE